MGKEWTPEQKQKFQTTMAARRAAKTAGGGGTMSKPPKKLPSPPAGEGARGAGEGSEVGPSRLTGKDLGIKNSGLPMLLTGSITIDISGWPLSKLLKLKALVEG